MTGHPMQLACRFSPTGIFELVDEEADVWIPREGGGLEDTLYGDCRRVFIQLEDAHSRERLVRLHGFPELASRALFCPKSAIRFIRGSTPPPGPALAVAHDEGSAYFFSIASS